MATSRTHIRQVALLIESSRAYGRGLLRGIAAYAQEHSNWSLRHQEMSINADPPRWLTSLQTPIGVLACNDIRAQQLLNACHEKQIHVPDEIAVVGVDNDDVICPLCFPPLTSVEPSTRRIG